MRYLMSIVIALLLSVVPSCNYIKNHGLFGRKARILAAQHALQDSLRVADSLRQVQKHLLDLENARLDSIRSAEEARLALEKKNKYNIIVGSFITPEYAKDLSEGYRRQGYDPEIIHMEGTKFDLVSVESYENLVKARERLEQFQDTVVFDAWMFIR